MSDLATTEVGGEARSAWIYRTLYLDNHSIADNFYCPFCDIRLCPNNIDKDGEISKAPHFSAKWGPHINGCDGTPIVTEPHLRDQPRSHYIARDVKHPEVFTLRPDPRVAQKSGIVSPRDTSINAIHQRRENAGSLGLYKPSTYLLQTLVQAYNSAWTAAYENQKEKPKSAPKEVAKQILQSMPLALDKKTNYWDAFIFPSTKDHGTRRIYKGSGIVEEREKLFYLSDNVTPNFFVVINIQHVGSLRGYRKKMLDLILSAQQNQLAIKWYAYGSPVPHETRKLLRVDNLDLFYATLIH
ncbi:MAG: hypothetical protein ACYCYL_03525 [Acidithiobacillus sp.]